MLGQNSSSRPMGQQLKQQLSSEAGQYISNKQQQQQRIQLGAYISQQQDYPVAAGVFHLILISC